MSLSSQQGLLSTVFLRWLARPTILLLHAIVLFSIYLFLYLLVVWVQLHILLFLVLSLTVPWPFYDISHHFFIFFYIFVNWYKIVHPEAVCLLCEPMSLFCKPYNDTINCYYGFQYKCVVCVLILVEKQLLFIKMVTF